MGKKGRGKGEDDDGNDDDDDDVEDDSVEDNKKFSSRNMLHLVNCCYQHHPSESLLPLINHLLKNIGC